MTKTLVGLIRKIIKKKSLQINLSTPSINWHEDFVVYIASLIRPSTYVELGLYHCEVFNRIVQFSNCLVGVDINPSSGKYMKSSDKTKFVCSTTEDFIKTLRTNALRIDLLFIDADHSKEAVLSDFLNMLPFVSPHGLILIHDTHPGNKLMITTEYCGNGYLAIEELQKDNQEYEMVTLPVSPGLTICRKRIKQLSWNE